MFRRLNQMLMRAFGAIADDLDFVIQTRSISNASIGDSPLLIPTGYTSLDNLPPATISGCSARRGLSVMNPTCTSPPTPSR